MYKLLDDLKFPSGLIKYPSIESGTGRSWGFSPFHKKARQGSEGSDEFMTGAGNQAIRGLGS